MTEDHIIISLRCRCGHVHGTANIVARNAGFRFICYCRDCQAFAHFLGRTDVLDPAGGTDIFHMPADRMKLAAGTDTVRCLHFSKSIFRWYADCCRTPIANTAGASFPVVGLIHAFMDHEADGRSRDARLGAPLCRRVRSASSPFAFRHCLAGGGAGSAGPIRFSTVRQARRPRSRACLRRASALASAHDQVACVRSAALARRANQFMSARACAPARLLFSRKAGCAQKPILRAGSRR
jgi:hypothetical protein